MRLSLERDRLAKLDISMKDSSHTLSEAWKDFGVCYQLTNTDLKILRAEDPWQLTERSVAFLACRLHDAVRSDDWESSEVVLSILVRSDVLPVIDVATNHGLGDTAHSAMASNAMDAPGAAGTTARLARLLLAQLLALVEKRRSDHHNKRSEV